VTTNSYTSWPASFIFTDSKTGSFAALPPARTTADRVYGQLDMSGKGSGTSGTSLSYPKGVAVDASGGLYVADTANNRVLYYAKGSTTASVVYGQQDLSGSNAGPIATGLHYPNDVAVDNNGGLYVADTWNNRVLYYTKGMTTTTEVRGQTTMTSTTPGTSATSLTGPMAVAVDANGKLYVADTGNNRVLFVGYSSTAGGVYGQQDLISSGSGTSATGLNAPIGVAVDGSGGVYVADTGNNRVLYYPIGTTTATVVYGQPSMTGSAQRTGATGLDEPAGVAVDGAGGLYVADEYNSRVLHFPASGAARP
jgi:sugar lactone lactonase YvrE